ncbi:protein MTSS 1-like isoform X3 [Acipenser oxyrinchus oxyrinchus]|uniref:Protein MTSS 1-like isoform X3 n=1 Tax=Acipenser oxyrinchus oxyrinchus TaxID=40147 RepID=A0AAD8FUC1_ACIOX|nr:protein MTSS 1-like isoform X3 [Acipenser oxyrinchus oxyrinchus]
MDVGIEKECSALGGLFQTIMIDMKSSYPAWEDFVSKGAKLQSQLRTTIVVTGSFLDAFQKVADLATGTRGATKEIGSALTRMCMRHRSIESKLKLFTSALTDSLINPLELKIEEWKKVASQLDKDHAKEYKKARANIKKKSSDTIKLQKRVKKGKDDARMQLEGALQDVNDKYMLLEETEKRAVCRALIEERGRFCSFVSMLKPVLDEEIGMLGEVTHLQTILEDLTTLTMEPSKLPLASEQVILDLKGSDYNYTYQTPPASPSNTMSRKGSISSTYQNTSIRHVPSLDSISSSLEGIHLRPPSTSIADGGSQEQLLMNSLQQKLGPSCPGSENGTAMPPPQNAYTQGIERPRAMTTSTSCKPHTAREQLALALGQGLNSDAPRSSRDSLHCSSGYSTQTTTPSCSEDTIPSHAVKKEPLLYVADYDSISLHGGEELRDQVDFDKSSTIPRHSDISLNYRKMFQSKRPASTVSLLADPEPIVRSPHVATIRRKPSSKPTFRRGTLSGGVPIPICTPQVPMKAPPPAASSGTGKDTLGAGRSGSDELVNAQSELVHMKNNSCTSTHSLSAISSPYYSFIPSQAHGSTDQLYTMNRQQQFQYHQQQQQQLHYQQQQQQQHALLSQNYQQQQLAQHSQNHQQHVPARSPSEAQHPIVTNSLSTEPPPPAAVQPSGSDMLSMIRRGVLLRKTLTNDRSAPQVNPPLNQAN